jgi:hypothetical protein
MLFYRMKQNPTAVLQSGSITAFADAGGGQVTVTAAGHALTEDDLVTISGTTNYNGSYTATGVTTNTFEITHSWDGDDATGTWTGAGTWAVDLHDLLPPRYLEVQPKQIQFQPMLLRQIYVKSATSTNLYNLTLTDYEGVQIRRFEDITESWNDLTPTPVLGNITFTVTQSDYADEFTILAIVSDER